VHELHHDPSSHGIDRIHETALQVLHAAAHIDAISTRIRPAINRGDTVIMDRFWWSTVVYGRVTGVDAVTIGLLQQLAEHHWNFVVPTAAYLLMGVTECPPNVQSQPDQLRHAYADFVAGLDVPFPVRVLYASGTNGNYADQILQDIGTHGRPSPA
jgi:dTMP kinase